MKMTEHLQLKIAYHKLTSLTKTIQMATDFTEPFSTLRFFRSQKRPIVLKFSLEKLLEPERNTG